MLVLSYVLNSVNTSCYVHVPMSNVCQKRGNGGTATKLPRF